MNWLTVLAFQGVMIGLDVLGLLMLARFRRPMMALGLPCALLTGAILFAMALGDEPFGMLSLFCYGLFLHLPLVLLLGGCIVGVSLYRWRVVAWLSALGIAAIGCDAFFVEPSWLEVTSYSIASPKVTRTHRIVLIADLQTDRMGDYERSVLQRVRTLQPDLILLAGDYLQVAADALPALQQQFGDMWRTLPLNPAEGTIAVTGNVDPPGWQAAFEGLPVTVLKSTTARTCGELQITGLSLSDSFNRQMQVEAVPGFHVVLGHGPDFALSEKVSADLLLAGHTHGGQVCLPGIGPLLTLSQVPRAWASGRTALSDGRTLIVSRGIGLERGTAPRLRFLCRPQLVVIEVRPVVVEQPVDKS